MNWDIIYAILALLTGIGIFLAGISMLSASLRKNSTHKMRAMFKKIGNNRFSGLGIGTGVTALIQSSTAVTVMTVGMVGVGILSLFQATSIIMGANIGTTLTNLMVGLSVFKVKWVFMALALVGVVLKMISKKDKVKLAADILLSVGILFVGLHLMSGAFSEYDVLRNFFIGLFEVVQFPLLLILLGTLFTIIIQSSTASMAIYISMVATGIINFETAMFLTLGTEMGTCFTALLASLSGNRNAKRAALTHLMYNVFGTVLFTAVIWPLKDIIIPAYASVIKSPVWQIALFPLINNVISVAILIWFIKPFNKFICFLIKDKPNSEESIIASYTDEKLLKTPLVAMLQAIKAINYIGQKAKENIVLAYSAVVNNDMTQNIKIEKEEQAINALSKSISDYLIKIGATSVSALDQKLTAGLQHVLNDLERIGDQAIILLDNALKKKDVNVDFSEESRAEVAEMFNAVMAMFTAGLDSDLLNNYYRVKNKNLKLKEKIDSMKDEITNSHIKRLQDGNCRSEAAEFFYATITALKSISDHLVNIDRVLIGIDTKRSKIKKVAVEKKVEEKLLTSLTANSAEILPHIPYLLQDFWELGSDPSVMAGLITKHANLGKGAKILDLACGKGAVSVKLAKAMKAKVKGVDIIPEFIEFAKHKAREHKVGYSCRFEVGDINQYVKTEKGYDVVIFGASGNVLGSPLETLNKLKATVRPGGYILIDESYLPDDLTRDDVKTKYEFLTEKDWRALFDEAGLELVETDFGEGSDNMDSASAMASIKKRAGELAQTHPDKADVFKGYVEAQQNEYNDLDNKLVSVTWILKSIEGGKRLKPIVEIERKFLVKKMPKLEKGSRKAYERFFTGNDPNNQTRVQRKNNKYEMETKVLNPNGTYEKTKAAISRREFLKLIIDCKTSIKRTSYRVAGYPRTTIKIYKNQYKGLIRAEFEFYSQDESNNFVLPNWAGAEITDTNLGLDAKLVKLTRQEFLSELQKRKTGEYS
ncbi:MAG: Na/Pi symporter [Firmicutes bacterium]|nr:Na/Pi symporter [Bacillota bacterium]